jgi:hypothetical protein
MKIGLIADTHMPGTIADLWPQASRVFKGVDAILHAGDLHTLDIVEHLSDIAPTYVSRGNGDLDIVDQRLKNSWLIEIGGLSIGLIHQFPSPIRKSPDHLERHLGKHFPVTRPDVLVYGHTHLEDVRSIDGRLYINPGSPTLPRNQSLRLGTIGVMEINETHVSTRIMQLTNHGAKPHAELTPHEHPVRFIS